MGLFQKMLVGVDGSASSLHALRQALRFSHGEKIPCIAASVVPPYEGDLRLFGVKDIKALLREPCEKALEVTSREAQHEGLAVQTVCMEGKPHEALAEFAEENRCDVIVLGTRGDSLEKYLLGSVTARVIGYSPVDVLAIPLGASLGWQNILCPVDGSETSGKVAQRAIRITATYRATLKFISATDMPIESYAYAPELMASMVKKADAYVQEVKTQASLQGIDAAGIVREGDAAEAILNLARTENVDLITLGSHGKSGLKRLLMGSVAERVLGNSPCPVLVVKK